MLIDFKEIPHSNKSGITQDIFEKFCRDFLEIMGYEIVSEPARGADGGLDIKVCENRIGVGGVSKVNWLVSCKHYAYSGKSITKEMEPDIRDRVESKGCTGFIGLYTTIANQSLVNSLEGLKNKIEYQLFDNEKIEKHLIGIYSYETLLLRYFPRSYENWRNLYYYNEPVKLFEKYIEIKYHNDIGPFKLVFRTTGHLIKQIRGHSDLKSALKSENIELLIINEFETNYFEGVRLKDLWEIKFPEILVKNFGIEIIGKDVIQVVINGRLLISYALYPNHLLISPEFANELNILFDDLKDILR